MASPLFRLLRTLVISLGLAAFFPAVGVRANEPAIAATPANHLIGEKSPYLLQHAHNPVDWYPWGEEAFAKARRENKPIFLSIGYSTCHWCHVMERESFENPAIARLINDSFVAIKVDREERPDVDATYMDFVEATTGGGGWPMTVFATPDLKPFAGGTYFPPEDRDGQPGLKSILPEIAFAWKEHRAEIVAQAGEITARLQELATPTAAKAASVQDAPGKATLDAGFAALAASFDGAHGGFGAGNGPKFPQPMNLNFLARGAARHGPASATGKQALDMDLATLRAMAAGGIHDQLGGGFHRYSTDPRWHVPHFEKMLYDQAQLAIAYLDAYQLTGDTAFAAVARDTLDYVRRDLSDPATGAFFSAEDADSQPAPDKPERVEGAFYVWKKADVDAVLGPGEAELFDAAYGVKTGGNVPAASDARGELAGQNVLDATGHAPAELAAAFHFSADDISTRLAHDREALFARRSQRPRPRRDDKTITAWNGLAISAFARAAEVLDDPAYLAAAQRGAAFLQANLYTARTGRLARSYRDGPGASAGFADDYAFLIQGLLDLYEADFDPAHLSWAQSLQATQNGLFWDDKAGGYFDTAPGQDPHVFLRTRNGEDNAEPGANSISALNLARLGQLLENDDSLRQSRRTVTAFASLLSRAPLAAPEMLVALDFLEGPVRQIVVAGRPGAPDTLAMLRAVRRPLLPDSLVILADGGAGQAFFAGHVDFFKDVHPLENGQATAYVCQNFACQLPTTSPAVLAHLLGK
jgi:uncharacterized protein YyaL (SSP411 family)